jgi:flotillin
MIQRSRYGEQFTSEVSENLKEWGIVPVKSIELMDVRDKKGEKVISNIMDKKKSFIDMESRKEVAKNNQEAKEAESAAEQSIAMKEEEKEETVGKRRAEREKSVGIAEEKSKQDIQEQAKTTKEKEMAVLQVDTVQRANIAKEKTIIEAGASRERQKIEADTKVEVAEKDKDAATHQAEARYIETTKASQAELVKEQNAAEAIKAIGLAEAEAKEKKGLAEVQPQITLAKEIGENEGYQKYLIEIKKVDASQAVGVEQAKNLSTAQIKIIANAGSSIPEGVNSVMDLFNAKGGQALGSMIEAFKGTEAGQQIIEKLTGTKDEK